MNRVGGAAVIVYLGKIARAGLGFTMTLLVARLLGPEDFGLFYLCIVIMIIGNNVLGEGLDPGVVRYYASTIARKGDDSARILSTALALRFGLAIPVAVVAWPAGSWVAIKLLGDVSYELPLQLGVLGAAAAALWSLGLAAYQAQERFMAFAALTPLVNVLRVVSIPVLYAFGHITLGSVLGLHVAFFLLGAGFCLWHLRASFLPLIFDFRLARNLLLFSGWAAIGNLCFLLQANLGVPLLSYYWDSGAAGIYAAGVSLLLIVDQLTASVLTVKLPAVSRLTTLEDFRAYVRRSVLLYVGLALLLLPSLLLADRVIILLYGEAFVASIAVFQILLAGFLVTLITHPLYLVFFGMNRPHLFAYTSIGSLVAWLLVGLMLIPEGGAIGAAWSTLAARITQAVLIIAILWVILRVHSESATGITGEGGAARDK